MKSDRCSVIKTLFHGGVEVGDSTDRVPRRFGGTDSDAIGKIDWPEGFCRRDIAAV